jgi:hypothetical protein
LRPPARPAGFTSPGSSRVADLPAMFQTGSSLGTRPSEVSPRASPPSPLRPGCPPCRFPTSRAPPLARLAFAPLPRLRGFEPTNASSPCGADLAGRTDAFSGDGVVHAPDGSLLSWLFPPFEDDLPASSHTSAGLLSWALIMRASPRLPLRFAASRLARALFRVSENRRLRPVLPDLPSVGSLSRLPSSRAHLTLSFSLVTSIAS